MLKKLARLINWPWLCRHHYVLINKVSLYVPGKSRPVGKEYHLACTHCGDIRRTKI